MPLSRPFRERVSDLLPALITLSVLEGVFVSVSRPSQIDLEDSKARPVLSVGPGPSRPFPSDLKVQTQFLDIQPKREQSPLVCGLRRRCPKTPPREGWQKRGVR